MSKEENLKIVNGKIIDEGYDKDFHEYHSNKVLELILLLPGIKPETVQIKIKNETQIQMTCYITEELKRILRKDKIVIHGQISLPVLPKSYLTQYNAGVLKITLAKIYED